MTRGGAVMIEGAVRLAGILAFAAPLALSQQLSPTAEAREAIARVAALLEGKWQGHGTVTLGAHQPAKLACTLTVVRRADGTVLLMDARYSLTAPGRPDEAPEQNEIAVLSFDPSAHEYRFDLFFADGRHETGSAQLDGQMLRIVNSVPGVGFRRITIDLSSLGVYHETGERSRDGSSWEAYSNLVLKRILP
jgi:hypothetical protein